MKNTVESNDRNENEAADHADVAFRPPVLLAVFIAIGFAGRWAIQLPFLPVGVSLTVGSTVVALSVGFFLWSAITMLRARVSIPTGEPTDAIVQNGPFRFSRNPIYSSMVYLQLGIGIWANSLWFVGLAIASAGLLTWGVIHQEERYLEEKFGEEYVEYRKRVRRWG